MYLYRTAVRIVDGYNATPASPLFTAKVFRTTPPNDKFDAIDIEFYVGGNLYFARTFAVAEALASISAVKVVGGGDTVSAISQAGLAEKFDHLSTGGGAALEYLENGSLPGIEILKAPYRASSPDLI